MEPLRIPLGPNYARETFQGVKHIPGYIFVATTTLGLLLQIEHTVRYKSAKGLSTTWLGLYILSGLLLGTYGLAVQSGPFVCCFAYLTILPITLLALKYHYHDDDDDAHRPSAPPADPLQDAAVTGPTCAAS